MIGFLMPLAPSRLQIDTQKSLLGLRLLAATNSSSTGSNASVHQPRPYASRLSARWRMLFQSSGVPRSSM